MSEINKIFTRDLTHYNKSIFTPYKGNRFTELVQSIRTYGIITPIIVREQGTGYQILSGHNRKRAAEAAGIDLIPAINLGQVNNSEAAFIVTESNIMQRGFMELSISERAKCVSVRHEAMKTQRMRQKLIDEVELLLKDEGHIVTELNTDQKNAYDLTPTSIQRYLRIDRLIKELKLMVDEKVVAMTAGVELSFLQEDHQKLVAEVIDELEVKVSKEEGKRLRQLEKEGGFDRNKVTMILFRDEIASPEQFKISKVLMKQFFTGYSSEEAMEVIEQALTEWFGREKRA